MCSRFFLLIFFCFINSIFSNDLSWKFKRNALRELFKFSETKLEFNMLEHISSFGYPAEEHHVVTDDGYILTLYRIPYGLNSPLRPTIKKPVVLLQPGLLMSSGVFVDFDPDSGLAFLLAERGYDVWMGNYRGTTMSRKHVHMDPTMKPFWDFSWHEMGVFDNPAMIDYILGVTNKRDLNYIGFSQGTTTFFVTLAEKPEFNSKINLMIALAPVAFLGSLNDLSSCLLLENYDLFKNTIFGELEIFEVMPRSIFTDMIKEDCDLNDKESFCMIFLKMINGVNLGLLNLNVSMFSHFPAGASVKQIEHYSQLYKNKGIFAKFDYGHIENLERYESFKPPEYDLTKIITPVFIAYSPLDPYTQPLDLQLLVDRLPNVLPLYPLKNESFSHLNFLYSKSVKNLLYEKLFQVLETYNSEPDFQIEEEEDEGFFWNLISTISNWIGF